MDTHEQELVECIKQGQQAVRHVVALLLKQYQQVVYEHCFILLQDAAQAQRITEETFRQVPGALFDYEQGVKPDVWLMRIARQLCEAQRPVSRFEEWVADGVESGKLSMQDRTILSLRKMGLTWREIGYIVGIPERAALVRGHRAAIRLAER